MNRFIFAIAWLLLSMGLLIGQPAIAAEVGTEAGKLSPAPEGAYVYLIEPADGEVVPSTFTAKFGLAGMGIAPAGIAAPNTGHYHLLIDQDQLPKLDQSIPGSEKMRHFGGGQTQARLSLAPGEHTLQLILGDHAHVPHDPPVISSKIRIVVK